MTASKIHFGHFHTTVASSKIMIFLAKKISIVAKSGCPPEQWDVGLQVMLEKIAGVALVSKLRLILLMEGDQNYFNKWAFGDEALSTLVETGYLLNEQYNQGESTAEDAHWTVA